MYKSMQGYPPNRIEGTETEQTIWCWESVDIQVFADHNENLQKMGKQNWIQDIISIYQ